MWETHVLQFDESTHSAFIFHFEDHCAYTDVNHASKRSISLLFSPSPCDEEMGKRLHFPTYTKTGKNNLRGRGTGSGLLLSIPLCTWARNCERKRLPLIHYGLDREHGSTTCECEKGGCLRCMRRKNTLYPLSYYPFVCGNTPPKICTNGISFVWNICRNHCSFTNETEFQIETPWPTLTSRFSNTTTRLIQTSAS